MAEIGPSTPIKNIRFINGEGGAEGGAVNLRSEAEPKGAGSEHGAILLYAPSRAAQAGFTEGADRS